MNILPNILVLTASFLAMEGVAWFTHKYIMHGWLWFLHRDHHVKDDTAFLERNDLFFFAFATPSIALIYIGFTYDRLSLLLWAGAGIALYGAAYVCVHDIFVHQRIRLLTRTQNTYFRAMRRAHKVHHKTLGKHGADCFGFLLPPRKYLQDVQTPASEG